MRRLIITLVIAVLSVAGGASAAQAVGGVNTTTSGGYWGCAGSDLLDQGVCVRNPVPERLPVPAV